MDLEQKSIERIKMASEMSLHHYGKPLICTYSGGKDSDVMLELFKRSGVPFEVHNSHTTVDAPPTVYHIRNTFRDLELLGIHCDIDYHRQPDGHFITMWNLIPTKLMPPDRKVRYCCRDLKEGYGKNRMIATGVRWAEGPKRQLRSQFEILGRSAGGNIGADEEIMLSNDNDIRRQIIERCEMKAKLVVNPILEWPDRAVWEYYWSECKRHNLLYKIGYYRVGCLLCLLAGKKWREKEAHDFPTYPRAYIRAFDKMLEVRKARGFPTEWKSGEEVYAWWMRDETISGQMNMFDDGFLNPAPCDECLRK